MSNFKETNAEAELVSQMLEQLPEQQDFNRLPRPEDEYIEGEVELDENPNETANAMSDNEIVTEVLNLIAHTDAGGENESDADITTPLNFYYGRSPGLSKTKAKDVNSSRYVSLDVQDSIEATVAEISSMFSTKEIATFTAQGEADEEQSIMESELVNYIFFDEMDGYVLLQSALRDALLHRNCTARVCWDEKISVSFDEYNNINPLVLPQIMQPNAPRQEVEIVEQIIEQESSAAVMDQTSYPIQASSSLSIKVKRTTTMGAPVVEMIKPENVIVSELHSKPTLDDANFSAFRNVTTIAELIALGFDRDVVSKLPEHSSNDVSYSRQHSTTDYNDYNATTTDNKTVMVYECYVSLDVDGDGITEYRHIIISGEELLLNEVINSNAMVGGVTTMAPHTYSGISLFDKLHPVQLAKTEIFRSIIDGTKLSSNPRIGVVTGGVNVDDILTSRTGGIIRMQNAGSIVDIPKAEVPQSSYGFLQLMDGVRNERGGSAISTSSQAQQVAGDTAHGIERVMSAIEMSNALLARTFAETFIRGIFKELHNVLRTNIRQDISAKLKGRWVTSNPSQWQKRDKLTITMGGSHNERNQKSAALERVVQKQTLLAQQGSALFSESKLYNALVQQAKLSGLNNPDSYYVDPNSQEGQKATQKNEQQKAEQKAKGDQAEQMMMEANKAFAEAEQMKGVASLQSAQSKMQIQQMNSQMDQMQMIVDKRADDEELRFKYDKLLSDAALKISELETKFAVEISKQHTDNIDQLK